MNRKCWICDPVPDNFDANDFFFPDRQEALEKYKLWEKNIFGENNIINYQLITSNYISALNRYNIFLKDDYGSVTDPQHIKVIEDLIRTLGTIRRQFGVDVSPTTTKEKSLYCSILRVIFTLNKENIIFRYRQSIIDLYCPILHVVWCGLYANDIEDTYIIEAVAKHFFTSFLNNSKHAMRIPGAPGFEENLPNIKKELTDFLKKNAKKSVECLDNLKVDLMVSMKWYCIIYAQEYPLKKTLEIWEFLMKEGMKKVDDRLKMLCANTLYDMLPELSECTDMMQALTIIQDISKREIRLEYPNLLSKIYSNITSWLK